MIVTIAGEMRVVTRDDFTFFLMCSGGEMRYGKEWRASLLVRLPLPDDIPEHICHFHHCPLLIYLSGVVFFFFSSTIAPPIHETHSSVIDLPY